MVVVVVGFVAVVSSFSQVRFFLGFSSPFHSLTFPKRQEESRKKPNKKKIYFDVQKKTSEKFLFFIFCLVIILCSSCSCSFSRTHHILCFDNTICLMFQCFEIPNFFQTPDCSFVVSLFFIFFFSFF